MDIPSRQVDIEVRYELKVDIRMSAVLKPWERANSRKGAERRAEDRRVNM